MSDLPEGIVEALVARPGDTLIVRVSGGMAAEQAKQLKERMADRLPGVEVLLVAGADQILAYRPDAESS